MAASSSTITSEPLAEVVVTEFMDAAAVAALRADFAVLYDPGLVDRPDDLTQAVAGARGLVVRNRTQVKGALLAAAAKSGDGALTQNIMISKGAGAVGAAFAAVNIFGGFLVTQRMLAMYKKKAK